MFYDSMLKEYRDRWYSEREKVVSPSSYPKYPYIDIESTDTTVLSVTTSTLPNDDVVYVYNTSEGLTNRVVPTNVESSPLQKASQAIRLKRFKEIILEIELTEE